MPEAVETTAYFLIAEAVNNAVKHSGCTRIAITADIEQQRLRIAITDDGYGGADPGRGTGLRGLGDRAAAVAGTLTLTSPPGGPTVLHADLPLHS